MIAPKWLSGRDAGTLYNRRLHLVPLVMSARASGGAIRRVSRTIPLA